MSALQRVEAGAFFALSGCPARRMATNDHWLITVSSVNLDEQKATVSVCSEDTTQPEIVDEIKDVLNFRYPYLSATRMPSKLTATQMKGRFKDHEAAEHSETSLYQSRNWRKPAFVEKPKDGRVYGNALHCVMQYISYDACVDLPGVIAEISRLVRDKYISKECAEIIDCRKIFNFFSTDLGKKLQAADRNNVLREFKFSILEDSDSYVSDVKDEKILLQGVVDCALIEADGLTVIDFKTDYVKNGDYASLTEMYRPQVLAYADALERIYRLPIKSKQIYFFAIDRFVELS